MRFFSPRFALRVSKYVFLAALLAPAVMDRAASAQTQPPAQASAQASAPPTSLALTDDEILGHLNNVITWYRHSKTQIQSNGLPTDAVYQANAEAFAASAVRDAFSSAEAAAPLLPAENDASSAAPTARQKLLQTRAETAARITQLQGQISDINDQIAAASKAKAQPLITERDQQQGELDLNKAMLNALDQVTKSSNPKGQSGGFSASVAQLKTSVPELFDSKTKAISNSVPVINNDTGVIAQLRRLYSLSVSIGEIDTLIGETGDLRKIVASMRDPLRTAIQATVQQGRDMATAADNPQNGQTAPTRQDFDSLTTKFNQLANIVIPLSQELTVLDQSTANLQDWRTSVIAERNGIMHSVFIRVAIIVAVLGLLMLLSDLWKRVTFRYVQDVRRRRQFLLIRRLVIGFLIGLVLIFSFVSEFSALATFAGFITAGLAVGLQTVLLSVAAYFFLIGRYGIRVGDRISIAGVTGDVVEVGFVRFYMMELAGTGIDLQPTGRIVAFSNAVLFQATSPMFKQAPGTDYTWHEIAISVNPDGHAAQVEQHMLQAVNTVYEKYRPSLDRQKSAIERRFEIPFAQITPKAQLQFSDKGLEAVVRYPVSLRDSVEADDQITRALIDVISKDETLKSSVSGLPKIRSAIRG